jgi:uncharacterized membrane protein
VTTAARPAVSGASRSRRAAGPLGTAILIVCLLGVLDAGYLVYVHYAKLSVLCLGGQHGHSSCATVQSSSYSKLAGVPVAVLGLLGYVVLLGTFLLPGESGRAAAFAVAFTGFGFSMYLTYREIFTIKAICEWCVGSAVFMTVLLVLTAVRFLRADPAAP